MAGVLRKLGILPKEDHRPSDTERGKVTDKSQATILYSTDDLRKLNQDGREAFFRYLCGDSYPEDEDICDVSSTAIGMNTRSRHYQFWIQFEQLPKFKKLFDEYIVEDDGKLQFPEVKQYYDEKKTDIKVDFYTFLADRKKEADAFCQSETDGGKKEPVPFCQSEFMIRLNGKIENDLRQYFTNFKKLLNFLHKIDKNDESYYEDPRSH